MIEVTFFRNGATMAFEKNEQVPELQEPWILAYAKTVGARGIDPTSLAITMPSGERVRIFQADGVLNWRPA